MSEKPRIFILILCIVLTGSNLTYAQRQVGIPFEKKAAVLLRFAEPYETMRVSFKERDLSTNIYTEVRLSDAVVFENKKGKPADASDFFPGMEVLIDGKKSRRGFTFKAVRLQTALSDWQVKNLRGLYEKFEDPVATIDGRRVVLAPGATVQGLGAWKDEPFPNFDYMQLGSFVEIEGSRDATGLIQARTVKTWPNLLTKEDKAIKQAIASGLQVPETLSGGQMTVGGINFRLTRNLDLQAFVTEVGYNLIPKWTEELADDDPTKIEYRFYVVNDPSFNASAFPDGTVIVHTGLLHTVENEAQLAAVLAHEIAHVTHKHGLQRFREQKKVKKAKKGSGLFKKAFTKVTGNNINTDTIEVEGFSVPTDMVTKLGVGALSNSFSRERESQADRVGLFYMVEAGYDPREAATMWTLLAERTADPATTELLDTAVIKEKIEKKFASIYSSHPEAVKRARSINIEIAANYSGQDLSQLTTGAETYQRIRDLAAK